MRVPTDQQFYIDGQEHLESEIQRLGLDLPLDHFGDALQRSLPIGNVEGEGRFCVRAMVGNDAREDGAPSDGTRQRYLRLARGGAGFLFSEPLLLHRVEGSVPPALAITEATAQAWTAWVANLRAETPLPRVLFAQLRLSDDEVANAEALCTMVVKAVQTALAVGFDGVELACEEGALFREIEVQARNGKEALLTARLAIVDVVDAIRAAVPDVPLAIRLRVYTARPQGFGTVPGCHRAWDAEHPGLLLKRLHAQGISLATITMNLPNLRTSRDAAETHALPPDAFAHEHPLSVLDQRLKMAAALRAAVPGCLVAMGGFTWLRQWMPHVAGGAIKEGMIDMVALGHFALAYPEAPQDWMRFRRLDPYRCCTQCGACTELKHSGLPVGCVLQEPQHYGSLYRRSREQAGWIEQAARCQQCFPAPCSQATPGGLDIPAFMRALARGDVQRAGRVLRRQQYLAGMCAQLAPYGDSGERNCIEVPLSGTAIPIRDLQRFAAQQTSGDASASVKLPTTPSGFSVAVVGAGPTGLAATAALLEQGHRVTLYEPSNRLGGVPERLIPADRFSGATREIQTLLEPAFAAGRLDVRYGMSLGAAGMHLEELKAGAQAVLLATGLWQEKSLGQGQGVYSGLTFLESVKRGDWQPRPRHVVLLAGGDCAMDAACLLKAMEPESLTIVYGGSLARMHWCMDAAWFVQQGVHCRTLCRPIRYAWDRQGQLCGVDVQWLNPGQEDRPCSEACTFRLDADLVVEAMGCEVEDSVRNVFPASHTENGVLRLADPATYAYDSTGIFAAGALVNGGASVPRCVEEGAQAAYHINAWLRQRAL